MKTRFRKPKSANGSAVILFLALLAIMLVLVAGNGKTLLLLKKDLRLIEQRQIQRLGHNATNEVSAMPPPNRAKPVTP